jgi:hypothetical protein
MLSKPSGVDLSGVDRFRKRARLDRGLFATAGKTKEHNQKSDDDAHACVDEQPLRWLEERVFPTLNAASGSAWRGSLRRLVRDSDVSRHGHREGGDRTHIGWGRPISAEMAARRARRFSSGGWVRKSVPTDCFQFVGTM